MPHPIELHDLACLVHVHSTFSDGTAIVPEIVAAAEVAGADCVVLTDHDTLAARRQGYEGWHGRVMLLVGLEVSPSGGQLLALDVDEEIDHRGRSEPEIAAAVAAAGGLAFPVHPFSEGSRISTRIGRPHGWGELDHDGHTGIELWSLATDTAERCASVPELLAFVRDPERTIAHPPADHLAAWDRLCAHRRTVAIGGLDAHQTGFRAFGRVLSPLPHARYFGLLRTHVLVERAPSGELEADAAGRLRRAAGGALPGVRLSELARLVGRSGASTVDVDSVETGNPFAFTSLTDGQIADEQSLLALKVNGADLSLDHGFPARVIVPALPGVHNTKWVGRMTFRA